MTNVSDAITSYGGAETRRRVTSNLRVFVSPWFVAAFLLCASSAHAQGVATGSIAGVVKDASGAVLPGVTVEATSPALIEKSRVALTDDQGAYKIVDLRPGVYAVTFTLSGFGTVRIPCSSSRRTIATDHRGPVLG